MGKRNSVVDYAIATLEKDCSTWEADDAGRLCYKFKTSLDYKVKFQACLDTVSQNFSSKTLFPHDLASMNIRGIHLNKLKIYFHTNACNSSQNCQNLEITKMEIIIHP